MSLPFCLKNNQIVTLASLLALEIIWVNLKK